MQKLGSRLLHQPLQAKQLLFWHAQLTCFRSLYFFCALLFFALTFSLLPLSSPESVSPVSCHSLGIIPAFRVSLQSNHLSTSEADRMGRNLPQYAVRAARLAPPDSFDLEGVTNGTLRILCYHTEY
jgi:hypothetical protein